MPTAFDVRALTSTVRIELDDTLSPDERESIRSKWTDLLVDESGDPTMTLRGSVAASLAESKTRGVKAFSLRSAAELAERITSEVTLSAISALQGEALMLHAAGIALDDGRVIGFVGPSGRGKTTASNALARSYRYVTDETLAIRPDGGVVPYPKPLSFGERPGAKQAEPASGLGLRSAAGDDLRLAALVVLDRRPDVAEPYVESLTLVEALPELVPQTSYLAKLNRPLRTLAEIVHSTGGVRRVVYSEAETLSGLIDDILATVQDDVPTLSDVASAYRRDCDCFGQLLPGSPMVTDTPFEQVRPGSYRRNNHDDALLIGDVLLVLQRHKVTVLEGVGPLVWLAADDSTEDEIRAVVLGQLPAPPDGIDPAEVVAAAIEELTGAHLLTRWRDRDASS